MAFRICSVLGLAGWFPIVLVGVWVANSGSVVRGDIMV